MKKKNLNISIDAKSCIPAIISILVLFIFGQILANGFASFKNISSILTQAGLLAIIAIGQAVVFFGGNGGIDMSLGAFVSMGALLSAEFMHGKNELIPVGILIAIVLGLVFGTINGLGIQFLKIPALAMTLAMCSVIDGFTLWVTKGVPQAQVPSLLGQVGRSVFGYFRPMMAIALIILVVAEIVMRKSSFGRSIYLIGSSRQAANICGLRSNVLSVAVYAISGAIACVGGMLFLGYVGAGQIGMGTDYTMNTIAAVVIGGASVNGGRGTFVGVVLGSIVYLLMSSVLVALGLDAGVRIFFQGVILAIILVVNCRSAKLRK